MKYLLIFITLIFGYSLTAEGNYVNQAQAESGAIDKVYAKMQRCEEAESNPCVRLPSNFQVMTFGDVEVDDPSKPNWRAIDAGDILDCTDWEDCNSKALAGAKTCPDGEFIQFDDKANWPAIDGSGWFLWCAKLLGYDKKMIKAWVSDAAKQAAKDIADAAKEAKELARKEAKDRLKIMDLDNPAMTLPELRAAVKDLREALGLGE